MATSAKSAGIKPATNSGVKKTSAPKKETRPAIEIPELNEFLKAGVHFGHRTSRWHPKMSEYIYTQKDGVHIIDIVKTVDLLNEALAAIQDASDTGGVLIVGTKGQAANFVQNTAETTGAFYINNRWPGGLFTNFKQIKRSVDKLIKFEEESASGAEGLVKKEQLLLQRDVERLNKLYEGIKFMDRLPKILIVIDSRVEKGAIREAREAGIPVVSLVDSNCDPSIVSFPIPANDDSIKSISLFLDLFGKAIEGGARTEAVVGLRNSHQAQLAKMRKEYAAKVELARRMEEEDRERMRKLRAGEDVSVVREVKVKEKGESTVVRVATQEKKVVKEEVKKEIMISDTEISARAKKALDEAGFKKVSEVKKMSKGDLTDIKGIGDKAADEIIDTL
jgi:small subunit ribosomal protein S2